jgi:subtilisin family serine protease
MRACSGRHSIIRVRTAVASYLIESTTAAGTSEILNLLAKGSPERSVYVGEYRHIIEADLSSKEVERLRDFAHLYADGPLAPFAASGAPASYATLDDVLDQVFARQAWEHSIGEGVTVAVVDSGINGVAREFPRWRRAGVGICFSHRNGAWNDDVGHGTMAAYVAAGNALLTDHSNGVAPMARVFPCRHNFTQNDAIKVLDRLRSMLLRNEIKKPLVLNCSYGWQCWKAPSLSLAHPLLGIIQDLVGHGVVVVCAAGNNHDPGLDASCDLDSDVPDTIWGSNSLDEVICVGAVDWNGLNTSGEHAKSSRGPGQFSKKERPKPDCVAPTYGEVLWGDKYLRAEWWGTSGAAPLVSGLAALVLGRTGGGLQPIEVKQVILEGCKRVGGRHVRVGHGIINCLETMKSL